VARGPLQIETPADLTLEFVAGDRGFRSGGNLWVFSDVRQFCGLAASRLDYSLPDGIVVSGPPGTTWTGEALRGGGVLRTLDLFPTITEFLHGLHVRCTGGALSPGETVRIRLKTHPDGFLLPRNAIDDFYFGLVEDPHGELTFCPVPGDRYWNFHPRDVALRVHQSNGFAVAPGPPERLQVVAPSESTSTERAVVYLNLTDRYGNPAPLDDWGFSAASSVARADGRVAHGHGGSVEVPLGGAVDAISVTAGALAGRSNPIRRRAAGAPPLRLYWGDLHGMMFNHRPLADYFSWARDVARLDWAGGQLFSYLTSVAPVWQAFKAVWRDFYQPGRFVSLPSAECGTPPDGSHRHWFLPDVDQLPPIFCEDRPAAADPRLRARFDPDTIYCADYRALYRVVRELGGFVHGHFHTAFYEGETLAEIYQKQVEDTDVEEAKINRALRQGVRLGIVAGSDTHDSRPANPFPEPGGPRRPAGLTGVWAERLDRAALFEAFTQRRCYATTGQRLLLDFRVNDAWMGSTAAPDAGGRFAFRAEIVGTAPIDRVELLVDGSVARTYSPQRDHVTLRGAVPPATASSAAGAAARPAPYCYLRVYQRDGNRAWSSPVWLATSTPPVG
jgi:hypothetical protein